jgi:hypothetical protein
MAFTFAPTTLGREHVSLPGIWVIPPTRVKTGLDKIYDSAKTAGGYEAA